MKIVEAKDAIHSLKPEGEEAHYYLFSDYEIIQTNQPPHSVQQWHHHETIWETIYVIEGQLVVMWREDGRELSKTLHAGDLVETERSPHTFKNATDKVARLMCIKHIRSTTNYHEVFQNDKVLD